MGISFGSTGINPYVGSKEIAEAYVGNQLIYQNKPPQTYVFLGSENKYYLADYATMENGLNIAKESGIYRLTFPPKSSVDPKLVINNILGSHFKFTAKGGYNTYITLRGQEGRWDYAIKQISFHNVTNYTEYDFTIDNNHAYEYVWLEVSGQATVYIDTVRFEN